MVWWAKCSMCPYFETALTEREAIEKIKEHARNKHGREAHTNEIETLSFHAGG